MYVLEEVFQGIVKEIATNKNLEHEGKFVLNRTLPSNRISRLILGKLKQALTYNKLSSILICIYKYKRKKLLLDE